MTAPVAVDPRAANAFGLAPAVQLRPGAMERDRPGGAVTAFVVPGNPITWKRAGRGGGLTFTNAKDRAHRDRIIAFARNAGLRRPLTCPVEIHLRFYFSRGADVTSLCVGDLDNLEKSVKDALKGVAFLDDRLVTDVVKRKRIDKANPRTEIEISEAVLT